MLQPGVVEGVSCITRAEQEANDRRVDFSSRRDLTEEGLAEIDDIDRIEFFLEIKGVFPQDARGIQGEHALVVGQGENSLAYVDFASRRRDLAAYALLDLVDAEGPGILHQHVGERLFDVRSRRRDCPCGLDRLAEERRRTVVD